MLDCPDVSKILCHLCVGTCPLASVYRSEVHPPGHGSLSLPYHVWKLFSCCVALVSEGSPPPSICHSICSVCSFSGSLP